MGVSEQIYYRWHNKYVSILINQAKKVLVFPILTYKHTVLLSKICSDK